VSETFGWVLTALAVLLVLGWYLSYSASRLDRLHHRVETLRAALDAQLARRAAAALEAAPMLDPATGLLVADAASQALAAGETRSETEWIESESGGPAEEIENDLTRALHVAFGNPAEVTELRTQAPLATQSLELLTQSCVRVQLARRFHNDAVSAAVRMRRKPVVRWARLAGHAPLPAMVEIDDSVPAGLTV
jgi:hypothetical protein